MAFIVADRVKETSTSTGAGPLTLAGAITGFKTFASRCAVGDTVYYCIQGVDAFGTPTAEWECGLGTYSAANTLTRTTVTSSSNSDTAVTFSAGTKQVYITMPAVQVKWAREKLTAARTYYVATTGSDSNDGLTVGTPFLTIQKAADVVSTIDLANYQATIQIADGTYTGATSCKPYVGALAPIITGNSATPANVIISTTSANCFSAATITQWDIRNCKLQTTTSGKCLSATNGGVLSFQNIVFGTCASDHIYASSGGIINCAGNYAIAGGASSHIDVQSSAVVSVSGRTVTITGTPAFSVAFLYVGFVGVTVINGNTFSGSATGKRFTVSLNGVVFVNGADTLAAQTYIPGNVTGTAATGGQYA